MSDTLNRDVLDRTAGEIVQALAAREVGALEVTDAAIARIEARDGPINAVVVRDFDRARAAARAADAALRGRRAPPSAGPADDGEGEPQRRRPAHHLGQPARSAAAPRRQTSIGVARLKAAGAVILGKTNVPPFLADWQSQQPGLRPHLQPLGPDPLAGRLFGRQRRGAGGRHGPAGVRLGHRRLDPDPGRLLRGLRPQADLQPDPPARPFAARARRRPDPAGRGRPAGPQRRRPGPGAGRAGRSGARRGQGLPPRPARRRGNARSPTTASWCSTSTP